jgi:hypothetical protein
LHTWFTFVVYRIIVLQNDTRHKPKTMSKQFYTIIFSISLLIDILIYPLSQKLGLYFPLLFGGNIFFLVLSMFSYYLLHKSIADSNPRKFINQMMASTMIRFFTCIVGFTICIWYFKGKISNTNIFVLMGMYAIYTGIESYYVMKLNKQSK